MRPTALKPGRKVTVGSRVMTFIRRDKAFPGQPAINHFQCDDYRGLNGPKDDGRCTMTDHYVSQNVSI